VSRSRQQNHLACMPLAHSIRADQIQHHWAAP
jgi:hypothetical protein